MIKVFGNESSGKKKNGLYYLVGYGKGFWCEILFGFVEEKEE